MIGRQHRLTYIANQHNITHVTALHSFRLLLRCVDTFTFAGRRGSFNLIRLKFFVTLFDHCRFETGTKEPVDFYDYEA